MGRLLLALAVVFPTNINGKVCRHIWELKDHVVDYLHPNQAMQHETPIPERYRSAGQYMNAQYPGPLIECDEDDDVEVVVQNNLITQGTAIHWHGMDMNNENLTAPTPWADGTHRFAHGSIMPGTSYTYRFKAYPPGSHWWHSHMDALQVDRGVKGPIVIHKKGGDRYKNLYDEERIIFISDSRRVPEVCLKLEGQAMDVGNPVCNEVNKVTWNGVYGDGSQEHPYPQIEVEKGKCYRFRWIGAGGNLQNVQLKIAKHNMTLISLDGQDIQPLPVKEFNLHTGERTDAIFCADQEPGNYLINATYDLACQLVSDGVGFKPGEQVPFIPLPPVDSCLFYAFIKYKGHDEVPTNAKPNETLGGGLPVGTGGGKNAPYPGDEAGIWFDLNNNEFGYHAAQNVELMPEPEQADMEITLYGGILGADFHGPWPGGHNWTDGRGQFDTGSQIGGWNSPPQTRPFEKSGRLYLSQRLKTKEYWSLADHWPSSPSLLTNGKCGSNGANIIDVPEDVKVINYGFPDWCDYAHHNQCFFMPYALSHAVAKHTIGGESIPSDPDHTDMGGSFYWGIKPSKDHPNYKKTLNLAAPLRKDMLSLWRHQWATIRIRPENPGHWLLHCHMAQHIPTGMITVLNVKPSKVPPIPLDTPTNGNCPVRGWNNSVVPEVKATAVLEVMNWIVDYQRPTVDGPTWDSKRIAPNQLDPVVRSSYALSNGTFPGAKIEAVEGDSLAITIKNNALADGVAIHWHGQEMKGTPWADGTTDVTQASIQPDTNFTYQFTAGPAGTHFYVAASDGLMGARGLKGAFIVHPTTDTRASMYKGEILMQVSDAWHEPETCLVQDGEQGNPLCAPIDKATFDGMYGDGSKYYPYPTYEVEEGQCYRIRMIGLMAQVPHFKMSIAGHDLTLLAVDGVEVQTVDISSINMHAGERYDFRLCANQKKGAYDIKADASDLCDPAFLKRTGQPKPVSCEFHAFLVYKNWLGRASVPEGPPVGTGGGKSPRALTTPSLDLGKWADFPLVKPLEAGALLKQSPDYSLSVELGRLDSGAMYLFTDKTPWIRPATPLLMTKGKECADGVPIIDIPEDATDIEMTISNALPDAHAVHLHGLRFQVMAMSSAVERVKRQLMRTVVPPAPLTKDTVAIPAHGSVVLRIETTNPGMWTLQAMSTIAQLRGATTALNVLPSKQTEVPKGVPTQGPCARSNSIPRKLGDILV